MSKDGKHEIKECPLQKGWACGSSCAWYIGGLSSGQCAMCEIAQALVDLSEAMALCIDGNRYLHVVANTHGE